MIIYTLVLIVIGVIIVIADIQAFTAQQRVAMNDYFNAQATEIHSQ